MTSPAPRKVCVVTGSRAEYGILRPLLAALRADPGFELRLVVCAMHLSATFGLTYREIEADGFAIDRRVEMAPDADTAAGVTKSIGRGCIGFADAFAELKPDLLVLLGDRYEILAAAAAALVARIPVAHIHGGELTEGAIDDAIRHAVTKMSHLHFCAAEPYRQRVIQLGEAPERAFTVGALGLDNLAAIPLMSRHELETDLDFRFGDRMVVVTYHPATLEAGDPAAGLAALLKALDRFPELRAVITYPNADAGANALIDGIEAYAARRKGRVLLVKSLGTRRYLSLVAQAAAIIGNSSSGIIEVPSFRVPTVNLGTRQRGRLRARSIVDCAEEPEAILRAIQTALSSEFRAGFMGMANPYGDGKTAPRILERLRAADLEALPMKRFYDLPRVTADARETAAASP